MDMLKDSCKKSLVVFSIPMILSLLTQQFYNICDTLIVGRLLGADMLSAVGNAGTIINITTIVCGGFELGGQMLFSEAVGRKNYGVIKKGVCQMLVFSAFTAVIISTGVIFFRNEIFAAIQLPKELYTATGRYFVLYMAGIIFLFLQSICNSAILAMGDSKSILILSAASSVINIVLDYSFIRFLEMGIEGTALATVIAQAAGMTGSGYILRKRLKMLPEDKEPVSKGLLMRILGISIPSMFQQFALTFGGALMQTLINSFGTEISNGYVVVQRVTSFGLMPVVGLAQSLSVFGSANRGAMQYKRIGEATRFTMALALGYIVIMDAVFLWKPGSVVSLFLKEAECSKGFLFACHYLSYSVLAYLLTGVEYLMESLLRGFGRMKLFLMTTLVFLVLNIGLAWILAEILGPNAIWISNMTGRLAVAILSSALMMYVYCKEKKIHIDKSVIYE